MGKGIQEKSGNRPVRAKAFIYEAFAPTGRFALLYCLDSLAAFFQYLFQFLHGRGSQHGDSRLAKIGDALEDRGGGQLNQAKEILAYELTSLVHGEEEAKKAQESARALFAGGAAAEMPTAELSDADLSDGSIDLLSIVQKSGLCASRSEARRNVEQGGVSVDGEIVKDIKAVYTKEQLSGEGIVVKRGKKNFRRVVVK